jgi:nitrogen fixation protein NifB
VNDQHLAEVSRVVKSKGAFLHNVMPLIAEAEHGTFYGVMGQRGPTPDELQDLQDSCSGDMNMMRHCRQCRADAVGMLGEDRGDEFTLDKIEDMDIDYQAAMEKRKVIHTAIQAEMDSKRLEKAEKAAALKQEEKLNTRPVLMAVATSGQGVINVHFGHAKEFLIYEASPEGVRFISHRKTDAYCSGDTSCGETETTLQRTVRALAGCEAVLCSKVGYEPWEMLENAGIIPNGEHAMENIEEAVMAVYKDMAKAGKLTEENAPIRAIA